MKRLRVQHLLGRKVRDVNGKCAGRIEELRAAEREGQWVVEEFELGRAGLVDRLSIPGLSMLLVGLLGGHGRSSSHCVPWHQMDLADPKRPKLKCTAKELEDMQAGLSSR
jgi:hypothetical protein